MVYGIVPDRSYRLDSGGRLYGEKYTVSRDILNIEKEHKNLHKQYQALILYRYSQMDEVTKARADRTLRQLASLERLRVHDKGS